MPKPLKDTLSWSGEAITPYSQEDDLRPVEDVFTELPPCDGSDVFPPPRPTPAGALEVPVVAIGPAPIAMQARLAA